MKNRNIIQDISFGISAGCSRRVENGSYGDNLPCQRDDELRTTPKSHHSPLIPFCGSSSIGECPDDSHRVVSFDRTHVGGLTVVKSDGGISNFEALFPYLLPPRGLNLNSMFVIIKLRNYSSFKLISYLPAFSLVTQSLNCHLSSLLASLGLHI